MPIETPLVDNTKLQLSLPWERYLKYMGDDLLQANLTNNSKDNIDFKYTLNGNTCFCTYYQTGKGLSDPNNKLPNIILPYTALLAFDINGFVYAPGTTVITIPSGSTYIHFWYVAKLI